MTGPSRLLHTETELEVPFHHVDALRIVWHGHYPKYFEAAAMALLRRIDLDGGELVERRYSLVVIESKCRYAFPLRYGERVRVSAWITDYRRRLTLRHEITNLSQERRSARGQTTLAVLDGSGRLRLETPPEVQARIEAAAESGLPLAATDG